MYLEYQKSFTNFIYIYSIFLYEIIIYEPFYYISVSKGIYTKVQG